MHQADSELEPIHYIKQDNAILEGRSKVIVTERNPMKPPRIDAVLAREIEKR